MTIKTFWQNPYLTELETTITSVDKNMITVNETIFFAFSGGQESDHGTIGGFEVIEAKKIDNEIFYKLPENHHLKKNDSVKIVIDWNRRYKLMRLHFAAELVLELVCKLLPDIIKIGAHIAPEKARIDFQYHQTLAPHLSQLQHQSQAIIDASQPIITAFSDEENERRYWKIENFSQVACGGTHVKFTSEIGTICLKRINLGKEKERIEIRLN